MLKVQRGQLEQPFKHGRTQYGIDPVAGVQHQILAQPTENGGEDHKNRHADQHHDQRALGAVDDHFVDDGLGEQGGCQREQLDDQRGQQDFLPQLFVFQQLWNEPAKTKTPVLCGQDGTVGIGPLADLGAQTRDVALRPGLEGRQGNGHRDRIAGLNDERFVGVRLQDERRS